MALSIGELVGYVDLDTSGAESGLSKLGGLFEGAGGEWGKKLGAAGLVAGGLFGASLAGAINLEPSRDRVAAALDLTTEQAERAGKVSGQLYADGWGDSAESVDLALEAVMSSIKGMRNATDAELSGATEAALAFSETMQVDVSRAAEVAGVMIRQGLAKNATEAFDLLTEASSRVPAELRGDVLDATEEYAQFFAQIGMDGPAAMAMLVEGAKKGQYGLDKAGDAVKEFTIRATDMSTGTRAAYEAIGLDANAMANELVAGGDRAGAATDKIVTGLLGIKDPAARANAAIALFGTPLEDMSTKDIPVFLKSLQAGQAGLDDWRGATERAGNTLKDNAATNLSSFGRQIKSVFVTTLGGQVLPVVTSVTGALRDNFGPALQVVVGMLGNVVGFLRDHTTTAKVLGAVLLTLAAVTAAHAAAMGVAAAGGMAKWLLSTRLISGVTKVAAAVQWAWNAAMAANPIVLIVALLAALVAAVVIAYKKNETFRKIVDKVWNAIKAVVSATVGWLIDAVPAAWNKIKDATSKAWTWIKDNIKTILAAILVVVTGPIGALVLLVVKNWDKIKAATSKVWNAIKGVLSAVWNAIKAVVTNQVNAVKATVSAVWNGIKAVTSAVWNAIKAVVANQVGRIVAVVNGVQAIVGKVRGFFGSAKEAAVGKLQELLGWLRGLPGRITGAVGDLGDVLYNAGRAVLQGLIDGITDMIGNLSSKLGSVTNMIPDWKGPMEVDAKLLAPNGRAIMQSLVDGFDQSIPAVRRQLRQLTADLPTDVGVTGAPASRESRELRNVAAELRRRREAGNGDVVDALARVEAQLRKLPRSVRQLDRQGA